MTDHRQHMIGRGRTDDDFDTFYLATYPRLVVQVFAVTGNLHDAEDATQEAFARACVRWNHLRAYDSPGAWVRRVAFNLALHGRRRVLRAFGLRERLGPPSHVPALSVDHVALVEALAKLPLQYRQVLVLHYLADLPVEQVAGDLGIAVGTAKSRLSRARDALAIQLANGEEVDRGLR
jgi:RNA polymerase sigma-70 factor (ECF subfamily)